MPAARDVRHTQLSRMTRRDLIRACGARGIIGGVYPLEAWSKDDLITSLLSAEFPESPNPPRLAT
jgi:hypothetical protein